MDKNLPNVVNKFFLKNPKLKIKNNSIKNKICLLTFIKTHKISVLLLFWIKQFLNKSEHSSINKKVYLFYLKVRSSNIHPYSELNSINLSQLKNLYGHLNSKNETTQM